tara:strand:+ start:167319 stop:167999 length:681 start_codon:yes stop_codon:yes gene_type:complete
MKSIFISLLLLIGVSSCIKDDIIDDYVQPRLNITSSVKELAKGDTFYFEAQFLNNIGLREEINPEWISSDTSIISFSDSGIAFGKTKGDAVVMAKHFDSFENEWFSDTAYVTISDETIIDNEKKSGTVRTTSQYTLQGDFEVEQLENGNLLISFAANYEASDNLPGLFVYLTNNPNTTNGALEIGRVTTFSGEHSYEIENVNINDYSTLLYFCKPFNVKVGDGTIQ